ncbi:alpha/beta fold hydrolase [Jiangella alkaliphila]|uniref:TAP-like protein n=1 Tax=Jiangella alkaliphila TaxID=419479 RepID=A0A1H2KS77_9ACTN|nr:alpha/beta hydrolase [Jiangella alkaliphila]SDU71502.1 TAP-like protein [Jiangella alkaliphila]
MVRRTATALVAAALLLGPVPAAAGAAGYEAAPTTSGAEVRPSDCLVAVPTGGECGVLTVPEYRADPGSRTVELPYVHVRSDNPTEPPLVFMNGGPGSGSLQLAGYFSYGLGLRETRDVVVLEQRGGARSTPSLQCPGAAAAMADAFTTAEDPYEEFEPAAIAMRDCLDDFEAEGGDPRGYTVAESALDLRDLREALGYDSWSVYGLSWSTQVMAEAARIDPAGVDAVVLDSFSAPDRDFAATAYEGLELSLDRLGERSGGDFPDPYADLLAAADLLDADPVAVDGHNPVTGRARTFELTGDDLVTFVHAGLYDVELLPVIPYLLDRLADGNTGALSTLVDIGVEELTSHTLGQYWVMQCQDEVPFRRAGAGRASPLIEWLVADEVVCAELGLTSPPLPPAPVAFTQPALVLAGGEDPVTPAAVADEASAGLPDRQFLEFAGVGHAVLLNSRCGRESIAAWLADPGTDVTELCDRATPAYGVVGAGDLHPTTRVAQAALAVDDGDWAAAALPAAFAVLCLGWLIGWLAPVVAGRRRDGAGGVVAVLTAGIAPVAGTVFLLAAGGLIWVAAGALPTQLVVGVPPAVPWLGLLLVAGAAGIVLTARRTTSTRGRVALAGAGLLWLAFAAWFVIMVVLPS